MVQPGPEQGKKIELPSSGLAEDILGMFLKGQTADAAPPDADAGGTVLEIAGGQGEEGKDYLHLVGFYLNSEEYALDISQVQEIIRTGGWTRVPNAPGHIKGVINLRGRIIPIVDPKVRMNLALRGLTKSSRIMVVEVGGKIIGILVDGVSQVLRLPTGVVEPAPDEVCEADKGFITGVGKLGGRLIILLDLAKVIGREEKMVGTVAAAQ